MCLAVSLNTCSKRPPPKLRFAKRFEMRNIWNHCVINDFRLHTRIPMSNMVAESNYLSPRNSVFGLRLKVITIWSRKKEIQLRYSSSLTKSVYFLPNRFIAFSTLMQYSKMCSMRSWSRFALINPHPVFQNVLNKNLLIITVFIFVQDRFRNKVDLFAKLIFQKISGGF